MFNKVIKVLVQLIKLGMHTHTSLEMENTQIFSNCCMIAPLPLSLLVRVKKINEPSKLQRVNYNQYEANIGRAFRIIPGKRVESSPSSSLTCVALFSITIMLLE